jgi:hypothetical protein
VSHGWLMMMSTSKACCKICKKKYCSNYKSKIMRIEYDLIIDLIT